MEHGINRFLIVCPRIEKILTWSSLLRIDDVDELLSSTKPEDANLTHSSIATFYQKIAKFKQENP